MLKNFYKYLSMLEDGYLFFRKIHQAEEYSRLEYLSDYIFDFSVYDSEIAESFAFHALQVCHAINTRTTFKFIEDPDNYRWYLLMCNMPFFMNKISWGTSIRGAFWQGPFEFERGETVNIKPDLSGLFDGKEQLLGMEFTLEEWDDFIKALVEFGARWLYRESAST